MMLIIIAGGYDSRVSENVEHLDELDSLAKSLHLTTFTIKPGKVPTNPPSTSVIFLPSFNEAQRTYLLSSSLCLLYTPSDEHFGIVPVEAMYGKLPVIAVNSGGPLETVVDKETGFLCDPEPNAFSSAMKFLVDDPNKKSVMGAIGRDRVKERFTLENFVSELENIIKGMMGTTNRSAAITFYGLLFVFSLVFLLGALVVKN
jgi:alpha-1,3/alpha-1,6-mannosyltransferase